MKRYLNWCAATHKHDMLEKENGPWIKYDDVADALALLRELNDALLPIPDALQARVDAVLDRAEEK